MREEYIHALRGAEALKSELEKTFGGLFRTIVDVFPGGTTITVEWVGGPWPAAVAAVAVKYEARHSVGGRDLYQTIETEFTRRHGGAKYVMLRRQNG